MEKAFLSLACPLAHPAIASSSNSIVRITREMDERLETQVKTVFATADTSCQLCWFKLSEMELHHREWHRVEKSLAQTIIPSTIKLLKELEPSNPTLFADSEMIRRVLSNFLMNALEAMSFKGTLFYHKAQRDWAGPLYK